MRNYTSFNRNEWAKLAPLDKVNITKEELADIKSLGDVIDLTDVHEIYTSLISYLHLVYQQKRMRKKHKSNFCIKVFHQLRLSSVFRVRLRLANQPLRVYYNCCSVEPIQN